MLPLVGAGIVGVLGMVALAVDVGYWSYQQRLEQSAADSAAVAGAIRLNYSTTGSTATPDQAARAAATQNGFTDDGGVGNVVVATHIPPLRTTPPHPGATAYPAGTAVEVVVATKNKQFFSGIFGQGFGTSSARAVAVAVPDYSACLWQLDLTKGIGLTINGNKPLQTLACGVIANGTVTVPSYVGTKSLGYWLPNNPSGVGAQSFPTFPLPAPATDPCARVAGCAYLAQQFASGAVPALPPEGAIDASKTVLIDTGGKGYAYVINCCPIANKFGPTGIYYIYGGISGTVTSDSATLVNVNGTFNASGLGAAHPYFSAPVAPAPPSPAPPTTGVAYYQPPSNTNVVTLNGGGNGTTSWNGMFYAPTASVTSNGGSITLGYAVVGDLRLNGGGGGAGIIIDPTLGGLVNPLPGEVPTKVVLSE
ncbi:MAG: hypothetical protein NVS2B8_20920 [Vulcanimicrobiaceae bacterium]